MIKCENVTIKYDGFTAFENLSFEVKKGEWFFITGENGCGKSTLVKTILGLEKASEGTISKSSINGIGYAAQQTQIQNDFPASVYEIVLSGHIKKAGLFYSKKHKDNAFENIKLLGIEDIKNACFSELSGGQKQRVLLARALCAAEELLVLDEPMTALDAQAQKDLYEILQKLHKNGMTIIMVSHDMNEVMEYADRILHFEKDRFFCGSVSQFKERIEEND